jgi:hypothetical protein
MLCGFNDEFMFMQGATRWNSWQKAIWQTQQCFSWKAEDPFLWVFGAFAATNKSNTKCRLGFLEYYSSILAFISWTRNLFPGLKSISWTKHHLIWLIISGPGKRVDIEGSIAGHCWPRPPGCVRKQGPRIRQCGTFFNMFLGMSSEFQRDLLILLPV